ncbi:hypothetical protein GSI_09001 [Ganoderma sinense ZZ0214-1]|uniref:F-box domain-containing protein n=1 Tax=Ganoderma sinense ZZ0214-1 TaxID=1077348 RepID=A0A2G8S5F0_9APHY|nr:hypothetical protein GSI_09001 [Ganoderma sinense ZZ0214-1]
MFSRAWVTLSSLIFPWSYFPSCQSQTRPSDPDRGHSPPRKHRKHAATPDPGPTPRLQPIEAVNLDVFRLIVDELHGDGGSLHNFSLASHRLRNLALPLLFSHCKWDIRHLPHERRPSGVPPDSIRHLARHLKHIGPFHVGKDADSFQDILGRFSGVSSVTFKWTLGALPWEVVKFCLATPRITSITLDAGSVDLMEVPPYPLDDPVSTSLKTFVFTTTMWREYENEMAPVRYRGRVRDMKKVFDLERECLRAVMLCINATATSLTLPVESTPILDMAKVSWPCLRELHLHGRFRDMAQALSLQELLPTLTSLETLSILAARLKELKRPAVLSKASPLSPSHPPVLPALRSLTLAYPDPEDGIFSLDVTGLTHLSLRDWPRFYNLFAYSGRLRYRWCTAIHTPMQCLSILKRMEMPNLTSLELVYMTPTAGADRDLLFHIIRSYPRLTRLEIHRYRLKRTERVPYLLIARTLSAIKSLRVVRLNLDFEDDHQAYCGDVQHRQVWYDTLTRRKGPEIVNIMQTCPQLEHVALLYHGHPSSTWAEFRPARYPGPKVVVEYDPQHIDSEMMRRTWRTT